MTETPKDCDYSAWLTTGNMPPSACYAPLKPDGGHRRLTYDERQAARSPYGRTARQRIYAQNRYAPGPAPQGKGSDETGDAD